MLNIQGEELILLIILAFVILGPSRLPMYAAKLAHLVRELRTMAEGAKAQIKDEMGPAFDDVDWRQLDPRQYDPRRIVREALSSPAERPAPLPREAAAVSGSAATSAAGTSVGAQLARVHDPSLPTPFDVDAT